MLVHLAGSILYHTLYHLLPYLPVSCNLLQRMLLSPDGFRNCVDTSLFTL